ncbi:MAG: sorting protein [Pedosphaera sp.]|nr:sorting protein [Pedosphaera sp.]
MRRVLLALAFVAVTNLHARADVVARWTFNSSPPDANVGTGFTTPSSGIGTTSLIGGATNTFTTGDNALDTTSSGDNSAWTIGNYPAVSAGDKTRGIQFNVSTAGKENIVITWSQRASATGSRYYDLQYSTNGTTFTDYAVITNTPDSIFLAQSIDLSAVAGVRDNANFAYRILAQFEPGGTSYVAAKTGSIYGQASLTRFDFMTVSGDTIVGGNSFPTISGINNTTTRVDTATSPLPVTVNDTETAAGSLTLSGSSSNPTLVPNANITFGGSGSSRTVTVTPVAGQLGTASITVTVTDGGGLIANSSFNVTVLPANTAPTISSVPLTSTIKDTSTADISININDLETPGNGLILSATSSNITLLPQDNIVFGGSGNSRTVTLTPATGQVGATPITIVVSDGTNIASTTFPFMVVPTNTVVFNDSFTYVDGSITTNSGFLWNTHSGTAGEMQVAGGQLRVASSSSEDVNALLIGAPYTAGSGVSLYAKFTVNFINLPSVAGDFFAHFKDTTASNFRGRLYAQTTNAASGTYRLAVANGSTVSVQVTNDLSLNTSYTVVERYNPATAVTTIWVNPTSETDDSKSATASDAIGSISISTFAFRETSGYGTILLDDIRVATTFDDALGSVVVAPPSTIPLNFSYSGNNITLAWTNAAFSLQAAPAVTGSYTNVPGATSPYTTTTSGSQKYFRLKF